MGQLLTKLFVKSTNCWQVSNNLVLQKSSKPQQESIFEAQKKIALQLSISSPFPSDIIGRSSYHWPWLSIQVNGSIKHLFPSSHWLIAKAKSVMNLILCSRFLLWVTNGKKSCHDAMSFPCAFSPELAKTASWNCTSKVIIGIPIGRSKSFHGKGRQWNFFSPPLKSMEEFNFE